MQTSFNHVSSSSYPGKSMLKSLAHSSSSSSSSSYSLFDRDLHSSGSQTDCTPSHSPPTQELGSDMGLQHLFLGLSNKPVSYFDFDNTPLQSTAKLDKLSLAFLEEDMGYESECEGQRNKLFRNRQKLPNRRRIDSTVYHRPQALRLTTPSLSPSDGPSVTTTVATFICDTSTPIHPVTNPTRGQTQVVNNVIGLGLDLDFPSDHPLSAQVSAITGCMSTRNALSRKTTPPLCRRLLERSPKTWHGIEEAPKLHLHPIAIKELPTPIIPPSPLQIFEACDITSFSPQKMRLQPTILTELMSPIEALPSPVNLQPPHPPLWKSMQASNTLPLKFSPSKSAGHSTIGLGDLGLSSQTPYKTRPPCPELMPPVEALPSPFNLQAFCPSVMKFGPNTSFSDSSSVARPKCPTAGFAAIPFYSCEPRPTKVPIGLGLGFPSSHPLHVTVDSTSRISATHCQSSPPSCLSPGPTPLPSCEANGQMLRVSHTGSHPQIRPLRHQWAYNPLRIRKFPQRRLYVIPESPPPILSKISTPVADPHSHKRLYSHKTWL